MLRYIEIRYPVDVVLRQDGGSDVRQFVELALSVGWHVRPVERLNRCEGCFILELRQLQGSFQLQNKL